MPVVEVRDTATARPLLTRAAVSGNFALSADGKTLAIATYQSGPGAQRAVALWDVDTGKERASFAIADRSPFFRSIALSADGKRVATATAPVMRVNDRTPGRLTVWDVPTGAVLLRQDNSVGDFLDFRFSPDGERIAFAARAAAKLKPVFHVRDVRSGKDLWTRLSVGRGTFSPDGRRLAVCIDSPGEPHETLIVDAATGAQQLRLEGEDDQTAAAVFSPDGKRILTTGRDARLWDALTGEHLLTLEPTASADVWRRQPATGVLVERHQFRDDGRRLFALRTSPLNGAPNGLAIRYHVILQVWDAEPLPDLRDLLAGTVTPVNNRQRLRLITLCKRQQRYAAAARLYRDAFAAEPALGDDVLAGQRYDAACCHLRAADGQGLDTDGLDEEARRRLRRQALAWLGADLDAWRKRQRDVLSYQVDIVRVFKQWREDAGLAAVRAPDAVAQLPADEQEACRALWAGVDAIVAADTYFTRGIALEADRRWADAVLAYRKAIELNPANSPVYERLARALEETREPRAAATVYRTVAERFPGLWNYLRLGWALEAAGQRHDADAAFRKAALFDPKQAGKTHLNRGLAFTRQQQWDNAAAELRRAAAADPEYADAHANLAWVLQRQGRWDDGNAAARQAIALNPRVGWYHNTYGWGLEHDGRLEEALAEYQKALGLPDPGTNAAVNRKNLELQVALIPRLNAVDRDEARPADAAEELQLAKLAVKMRRWSLAVRLYGDAFAHRPALAVDRNTDHRYDAACYAALAAGSPDRDAAKLDDPERARLRHQAVAWLRADLDYWTQQAATDKPNDRALVEERLRWWQKDPDLVGLRDADPVAKLPAGERDACLRLWADVAAVLDRPWVAKADHPVGLVYHLKFYDAQQRMNANTFWSMFTPDGAAFLVGGDAGPKGTICMWQMSTGKRLHEFVPGGEPWYSHATLFTGRKQLLTWYSRARNLFLWDLTTGKPGRTIAGDLIDPQSVAAAPDGRRILAGGNDKVLRLYDGPSGKLLARLKGHTDKCYGTFSADGKQILTYGDRTLRLWDAASGSVLHTLTGHTAACTGIFAPDGKQVLSYGVDRKVRLWDAATGQPLRAFAGPTDEVTGAAFVPGGKQVAAWGKDWIVRVWEVSSGKRLQEVTLPERAGASPQAAMTPDGRRLLVAGSNDALVVLDLMTGKQVHRFAGAPGRQALSISPDGRYAVAGSFRSGVYVWRLPD
jgi:WD40 repeat protein/Tfp pilus assembly protein PilF